MFFELQMFLSTLNTILALLIQLLISASVPPVVSTTLPTCVKASGLLVFLWILISCVFDILSVRQSFHCSLCESVCVCENRTMSSAKIKIIQVPPYCSLDFFSPPICCLLHNLISCQDRNTEMARAGFPAFDSQQALDQVGDLCGIDTFRSRCVATQ